MDRKIRETLIIVVAAIATVLLPVFLMAAFAQPAPAVPPGCGDVTPGPWKLVYTREPAYRTQFCNAEVGCIQDASNWQWSFTDAGNPFGYAGATDLVMDDLRGNVRPIYQCSGTNAICAAGEGRVSPDGKRILFTVIRGKELRPLQINGGPMTTHQQFYADTSELWMHNIETGRNVRLTTGYHDRTPDWYDNNTPMFSSNRAGKFPAWALETNPYPNPALQVYTARLDGDKLVDIKNRTPEQMLTMGPMRRTDGGVGWTSYQGYGGRVVNHSTPQNFWWPAFAEGNWTDVWYMAAHGSGSLLTYDNARDVIDPNFAGEGATVFRLLRPIVEMWPNHFCTVNYYRGSAGGANGAIMCYDEPGKRVEGALYANHVPEYLYQDDRAGSGRFVPSTLKVVTPFGQDQDLDFPKRSKSGKWLGRAGWPFPLPKSSPNNWGFVHSEGYCYRDMPVENVAVLAKTGSPCWKRVMRAKVPMVTNPYDTNQAEVIACKDSKWQCQDVRAIATWEEIYGIPPPAPVPDLPPGRCYLAAVDIKQHEVIPIPYSSEPALDKIRYQGNTTSSNLSRDLTGMRIDTVEHWGIPPNRSGLKAENMYRIQAAEADGSWKVEVPCETPITMRGMNVNADVIAHDQVLHSLRSGETRVCWGCHVHSQESVGKINGTPAERFKSTIAGQKP